MAVVWPLRASAATGVQLETRVRGIELVVHALVGGSSARSPEKHLGSSLAYDEIAPGYSLAAEAAPSAYSVAFEARLTPQGIGTYGSHFAEANEQLLKAMADPETANALRSTLVADFEGSIVSSSGSGRGVSPEGWTWHHASEPGVLQLVPDFQHAPGSAWQPLLHPGGVGGMSIWGADY
jgi:hypothetical protein